MDERAENEPLTELELRRQALERKLERVNRRITRAQKRIARLEMRIAIHAPFPAKVA
jgi:chaperonin cofactor prefoldin